MEQKLASLDFERFSLASLYIPCLWIVFELENTDIWRMKKFKCIEFNL
jgi:hypothetical protein